MPRKIFISKKQIIDEIRKFHSRNGRIPYKKEYNHYKASRGRFGTWNKAIEAAGFDPNPVRFAKKYKANDGHKCDSLAEKIIDDWFYARKIPHERNIPYNYKRMTSDFKVNGHLIEFFGLKGELKTYDSLAKEKERLWRKQNLRVIAIYPKNLFPNSHLNELLAGVYKRS